MSQSHVASHVCEHRLRLFFKDHIQSDFFMLSFYEQNHFQQIPPYSPRAGIYKQQLKKLGHIFTNERSTKCNFMRVIIDINENETDCHKFKFKLG